MAFDDPIINLKGFLHSGITEFVIPSCDLFLTDLGVAAREGTTGVASDVKERERERENLLVVSTLLSKSGGREGKEKMRKEGHLEKEICK